MQPKAPARLNYYEASAYLSISKRQLERAVWAGRVEHIKIGNSTSFTIAALDAFLDASTKRVGE